jgi:eukaryotic-like serine/threonine-protein kinase
LGKTALTKGVVGTLGRYEIQREIGRGRLGIVYEARDPALGRTIALRTIHTAAISPDGSGSFERRFVAEARTAARLCHPGIAAIHDVGRDEATGTLYVALEYLEGPSLEEIIRDRAPLAWREALSIVLRIAEALHHAHSRGVLHRDLTPSSVLLLPSGPKILGFGTSDSATARMRLSEDGLPRDAPLHVAPELLLGRPGDGRADVFSLGSIAYSLLTARFAFEARSIAEVVRRILEKDPLPPSRVVGEVPADVDGLVGRALARDPAERYPTAMALAEGVDGVLTGAPPCHRPHAPGDDATIDLQSEMAALAAEPAGRLWSASAGARTRRTHPRIGSSVAAAALIILLGASAIRFSASDPSPAVGGDPLVPTSTAAVAPVVPAAPSSVRQEAGRAAPAVARPARLTVDVEHPLEKGRVRVWVDGGLALRQDLEGHVTRNIIGFKLHGGRFWQSLEVGPGPHEVRVLVAWGDQEKSARVQGDFPPGSTRRLGVRLGRVWKRLSLEWQ